MEVSGLKVNDADFYLENKEALWVSRLEFNKNIGDIVALVEGDKVHGVAEFGKPIKIESLDDIFDRIPKSTYQNFKDFEGDLWAYHVRTELNFSEAIPVKDGLKIGQRNWIKNVRFSRISREDIEEMETSKLQKYHDRLHSCVRNRGLDIRDFNIHFLLVEQYRDNNMTHPDLEDDLDEMTEKFSPACRKEGETKQECISRKIPEIRDEKPDAPQDQVVAIAESLCSTPCSQSEENTNLKDIIETETLEEFFELSKKEASETKRIVEEAFDRFVSQGLPEKDAIQLAVSYAYNEVVSR